MNSSYASRAQRFGASKNRTRFRLVPATAALFYFLSLTLTLNYYAINAQETTTTLATDTTTQTANFQQQQQQQQSTSGGETPNIQQQQETVSLGDPQPPTQQSGGAESTGGLEQNISQPEVQQQQQQTSQDITTTTPPPPPPPQTQAPPIPQDNHVTGSSGQQQPEGLVMRELSNETQQFGRPAKTGSRVSAHHKRNYAGHAGLFGRKRTAPAAAAEAVEQPVKQHHHHYYYQTAANQQVGVTAGQKRPAAPMKQADYPPPEDYREILVQPDAQTPDAGQHYDAQRQPQQDAGTTQQQAQSTDNQQQQQQQQQQQSPPQDKLSVDSAPEVAGAATGSGNSNDELAPINNYASAEQQLDHQQGFDHGPDATGSQGDLDTTTLASVPTPQAYIRLSNVAQVNGSSGSGGGNYSSTGSSEMKLMRIYVIDLDQKLVVGDASPSQSGGYSTGSETTTQASTSSSAEPASNYVEQSKVDSSSYEPAPETTRPPPTQQLMQSHASTTVYAATAAPPQVSDVYAASVGQRHANHANYSNNQQYPVAYGQGKRQQQQQQQQVNESYVLVDRDSLQANISHIMAHLAASSQQQQQRPQMYAQNYSSVEAKPQSVVYGYGPAEHSNLSSSAYALLATPAHNYSNNKTRNQYLGSGGKGTRAAENHSLSVDTTTTTSTTTSGARPLSVAYPAIVQHQQQAYSQPASVYFAPAVPQYVAPQYTTNETTTYQNHNYANGQSNYTVSLPGSQQELANENNNYNYTTAAAAAVQARPVDKQAHLYAYVQTAGPVVQSEYNTAVYQQPSSEPAQQQQQQQHNELKHWTYGSDSQPRVVPLDSHWRPVDLPASQLNARPALNGQLDHDIVHLQHQQQVANYTAGLQPNSTGSAYKQQQQQQIVYVNTQPELTSAYNGTVQISAPEQQAHFDYQQQQQQQPVSYTSKRYKNKQVADQSDEAPKIPLAGYATTAPGSAAYKRHNTTESTPYPTTYALLAVTEDVGGSDTVEGGEQEESQQDYQQPQKAPRRPNKPAKHQTRPFGVDELDAPPVSPYRLVRPPYLNQPNQPNQPNQNQQLSNQYRPLTPQSAALAMGKSLLSWETWSSVASGAAKRLPGALSSILSPFGMSSRPQAVLPVYPTIQQQQQQHPASSSMYFYQQQHAAGQYPKSAHYTGDVANFHRPYPFRHMSAPESYSDTPPAQHQQLEPEAEVDEQPEAEELSGASSSDDHTNSTELIGDLADMSQEQGKLKVKKPLVASTKTKASNRKPSKPLDSAAHAAVLSSIEHELRAGSKASTKLNAARPRRPSKKARPSALDATPTATTFMEPEGLEQQQQRPATAFDSLSLADQQRLVLMGATSGPKPKLAAAAGVMYGADGSALVSSRPTGSSVQIGQYKITPQTQFVQSIIEPSRQMLGQYFKQYIGQLGQLG